MALTEFRFKQVMGGILVYAHVAIEFEPQQKGLLTIRTAPTLASQAGAAGFEAAARVGIAYAWDQVNYFRRPGGAIVTITEITATVVDTTQIAVVYAAAKATWAAMNLEPDRPIEIIPESRSLLFPIWPSR